MGFFQSLKDDLSEAVNGLIPEGEQNKDEFEIRDIGSDENDIKTVVPNDADTAEAPLDSKARKTDRPAAVTRASNRAAGRQMSVDSLPDIDLNRVLENLDTEDNGSESAVQMDIGTYMETEEEAAETIAEEIPKTGILSEGAFEEELPPEEESGNIILSMAPAEEEAEEEIPEEEIPEEEIPEKEIEEEEIPDEIPELPAAEEVPAAESIRAVPKEQPPLSSTAARARETAKLRREERKKMDVKSRTTSDETALITVGMSVRGDIESDGSMDVYGSVTGNINISGKLNVSGIITGNSSAKEVYADGAEINGDIKCEGSVKVGQSTVIIGNVTASSAVIAGAVKGDIDVHGPVILDSSAIVMGNIRSQSVQISNGAVVEGMCSQVYAAVNPSSFFEEFKKSARQG